MSNRTLTIPRLLCLLLSAAIGGCGLHETPPPPPGPDAAGGAHDDDGVHYDEVSGTQALYRRVSVCELFTITSRIGVFRFEDIIATLDVVMPSGRTVPRIHVIARAEENWFGEVSDPLDLPFIGGSWEGYWIPPRISAKVGERVVLFMYGVAPVIDVEPQIFRELSPGLFSNGQLFAETGIGLEELRQIVTNVRESESCPYPDDFGFPPEDETPGPGPDTDEGPADFGP